MPQAYLHLAEPNFTKSCCSALLNQGEKWARENGAVGIRLCSGIERENAHKFYFANGYKENKIQKNLKKNF